MANKIDAFGQAGGAMGRTSTLKWLATLLVSLALGGCGGGGGSSGNSPFNPSSGGGDTATATAADLLVTLGSTSVTNTGTDAIAVTVTAVSASRVALAGVPVSISANNNAVVVASGAVTDSNGRLTAQVQIGTDRSNRIITVTATNVSIQKAASFNVIGAKLDASALQAVLAPGAAGQIDFRLTDVNSNPMTGLPVTVSAVGLSAVSGTTDTNGVFSYRYTAPTSPGSLDISASAGGVTKVQSVLVQSGVGTIPNVTTAILSPSVQANPSVVPVNTTTSNNRSEVRARFLGAGNAPIANVRVKFDLAGDVNFIGGSFTSGNNTVYTDVDGIATTAYVPGTRSSPTDGVTVRACYYADDTSANLGGCANAVTATLTVSSEPLAVSIGTDNTISSGDGGLTYVKRFVVLVVDSSGQAKANVPITPSIDLVSYQKGFYVNPGAWTRGSTGYSSAPCANEDIDRNGAMATGEDINGNGQLDPRKSDVAISMIGTGLTDSSGVAVLQIKYAESVATWINYRILVSAGGVSGTEGRATWVGQLPASADDVTGTTPPAFVVSPYGLGDPTRTADQECRAAD